MLAIVSRRKGVTLDFRTIILLDMLIMLCMLISGKPEVTLAAFVVAFAVSLLSGLCVAACRYAVIFAGLFSYYHVLMANMRIPVLRGPVFSVIGIVSFVVQRIIPFLMLAAVMGRRKSISEITTSLERCGLPKGVILSVAVMLRYLPGMKDDFLVTVDAMKLKGLDASWRGVLLHPIRMLELILVPMLFRSLRVSEELSCAALVKGIENEGRKSSYFDVRIRGIDILVLAMTVLILAAGVRMNVF